MVADCLLREFHLFSTMYAGRLYVYGVTYQQVQKLRGLRAQGNQILWQQLLLLLFQKLIYFQPFIF